MSVANSFTPIALKRWSCQDKQLPPVDRITEIHIYDFDNTLFATPMPNRQLWNTNTCNHLQAQDFMTVGGWWHNVSILSATGQGFEKELPRAWEGCWNENIVELVRLSGRDENALCVLLTGRSEQGFSELIEKMISSKGLEFDMVCLKPVTAPSGERHSNTLQFKQALLRDIIFTYARANEIRVYEDRGKHVKAFTDFFQELNESLAETAVSGQPTRSTITAEVVKVTEQESYMDPDTEVAVVQEMINRNNRAFLDGTPGTLPYKINRSVFYTGYLLSAPDVDRLKSLVNPPNEAMASDMRYLANNILITPRPASRSVLEKVGGMGAKLSWRVTGLGVLEDRLWAARVEPAQPGASFYSENQTPCVVLATRGRMKPAEASRIRSWQPLAASQAFVFETTVGEKALLRIETEMADDGGYEPSVSGAKSARRPPRDEDFPPLGPKPNGITKQRTQPPFGKPWVNRGGNTSSRGYRPRRGNSTKGPRGNSSGSVGRGGRPNYRSLDDNVAQGYGGGGMPY